MDLLSSPAIRALEKSMQASSLRQEVIADNVANLNTPGFKRAAVSFEEEYRRAAQERSSLALVTTNPQHMKNIPDMANVEPRIIYDTTTSMRPDGNNVNLEEEMVDLAMNTFNYQFLSQQLSKRITMLGHVISEGRR
ncbi:MAG: flagellar basal body rod protein FlgB [Clostridia bacterium]|nr:MAG: flagellar basal body rod protein FlgB [Clostridia bacterium]